MLKESNAAALCSPVSEDSRPANSSTVSSDIKLTRVLSSSWLVTKLANSSKYFQMGLTTYSNQAKIKVLKVNKNIIKKYGAVSKECCKSMVQNLSKISKSKINVSITGIAGPGGASKDKPVGLVYIGIKMGKYLLILENKFKSKNRNSIQKLTVQKVIKIILNLI